MKPHRTSVKAPRFNRRGVRRKESKKGVESIRSEIKEVVNEDVSSVFGYRGWPSSGYSGSSSTSIGRSSLSCFWLTKEVPVKAQCPVCESDALVVVKAHASTALHSLATCTKCGDEVYSYDGVLFHQYGISYRPKDGKWYAETTKIKE